MRTAEILYEGNLRTKATHLKSGEVVITDAPTDNNGKGKAFSPTDLLATSLLSCMMTIVAIRANQNDISLGEMKGSLKKEMTSNPRRVKSVEIWLDIKGTYTEEEKSLLEEAAINCPVAKSLNPEIEQKLNLNWIS